MKTALKNIDPGADSLRLEEQTLGNFTSLNDLKESFGHFRFREYRETQKAALDFIINSKKKFIVIEAPTGSGKSLIGMAAGQLTKSFIYTVHSKPLQVQLQSDFPEASILFGRTNYPCSMISRLTCGECPLTDPLKSCITGCPYKKLKKETIASKFRVLNYAYLLTEANYVGKFSKQGMIVIDEADSLENVLYNFVSIAIAESTLKSLNLSFPKHKTEESENLVEEWREWAIVVRRKIDNKIRNLKKIFDHMDSIETDEDRNLVNQLERYSGISSKLSIFIMNIDHTWQSEIKEGFRGGKVMHFKPLWLTPALTYSSLWRHADRFILMSATFPPKDVLAKMFGITATDIDYLTLPSAFPVENRRCIVSPVADLTYDTQVRETPKIISAVKKILALHPGEKGLIHTINYRLRDAIMQQIEDIRLVTHDPFNKQQILDAFRASDQPLVLVSPSSERGLSLEDSQCRFIILCKAPFLSLGDKAVKARKNSGQIGRLWYVADMLLTVVQAMGRGVRHENDFCVSYLLDERIASSMRQQTTLMPPWFRDALEFEKPDVLFGPPTGSQEYRADDAW
jgi:Rad3-related DNA helicase